MSMHRWFPGALAMVAVIAVSLPALQGHATPARAQALGGYDLNYPMSLNTFVYFDDDVNMFVNPAMAYKYKDRVDLSLGLSSGEQSGMGLSPFGGFLVEPGDSGFVFGVFVNRDPILFGESAAIMPVAAGLISGGPGGTFNTSYQGGWGMQSASPKFPLDVFAGGAIGNTYIGANLYMAGGMMKMASEELIDDDDDIYLISEQLAKSLYTAVRIGVHHEGDSAQPGAYLGFAKLDSWGDAFVYDTDEGMDDPYVSHTEGLKGVMRILGGFRMGIPQDDITVTPHIGVAYATGQTFVDENLGDEDAWWNAANNENKVSALDLNAGAGLTYAPDKKLKVIGTASFQLRHTTTLMDDHIEDLDNDPPDDVKNTRLWGTSTMIAAPVLSIGSEYRPFKHLIVRGAVRGNILFGRDNGKDISYYGADVTSQSTSIVDQSPTPSLMASFGLSLPLGALVLDGTFGGQIIGSYDNQFFSRLDMRVVW